MNVNNVKDKKDRIRIGVLRNSECRVELQNCLYNGYEVAGYARNFVSSNDLFAPPAAAWTNRESTAQLGIRPAAGGANH
ncbi:MAG: hypothetical protein L6247_03280 [Desulfobacteraceae bacterium]|nr:hypothetical protein [Pseudomonadota bacterium]MBU4462768.1 hypothetical protein [Pseudomonadota bacterium]MCG2754583.1 hypothetical protein [Desulfobacteraceae bacterium]